MFFRVYARTMFMLIFVISLFSCIGLTPEAYALGYNYRGPFQGRVVDADTQEPIKGAVVFVEWDEQHMMAGATFYDAAEVLTDDKGSFHIPKKWSWNPWTNIALDSMVTIFKAGYGHVVISWDTAVKEADRQEQKHSVYNMRVEKGLPVFFLKKLTTRKERSMGVPMIVGSDVPHKKKRLLIEEIEKDKLLLR